MFINWDDNLIYVTAAIIAILALVIPLIGWIILDRITKSRPATHDAISPTFPLALFASIGAAVLIGISVFSRLPEDWTLLFVLASAFALGVVRPKAMAIGRKYRLLIQLLFSCVPLIAHEVLVILPSGTLGADIVNASCTVLFILGLLNFLDVINFIDGVSSGAIFIIAAVAAAVLNLTPNGPRIDDPTGVVFALALCGGSLGFVLFRRPPSNKEESDVAAMLLGVAASMILLRTWKVAGSESINPGVFLPAILIVPVLLAGIHRDRLSLFRRQRLALILISLGQLPAWIPVMLGDTSYMWISLISVCSIILWTARITQGRALRGWSMRVMAEPIADVLRVGLLVTAVSSVAVLLIPAINLLWMLASIFTTCALLIVQVTWWRSRLEQANRVDVVIFASRSDYHKAQHILRNCSDLFGRQRTRRARIGLRSKHLRKTVLEHLTKGDTVVILGEEVRKEVIGLRSLGDLIFARECLLLSGANHEFDPEQVPGRFADLMQKQAHRALAVIGFFVLSPAFLAIALVIKLNDGGPVFFRQERIGVHGQRFTVIKFRSMRVDAKAYDESPTDKNDNRITRIGRFLRRSSLDELPQLINVIQGDMRLVGPRPEMPFICARYDGRERKRLEVPPGVTGLWQVSSHRNDPIHHHVEYDLAYRHARGPLLDTAIVISTIIGGSNEGF